MFNFTSNSFDKAVESAGVADFALKYRAPLNLANVLRAPGYCPEIDGRAAEPVLVAPLGETTAIAIRGKPKNEPFSATDMASLLAVAPFLNRGLTDPSAEDSSHGMAARLKALLEVAEILSGVMDLDVLILTIMERACSLLNTERCSLFLVDLERQELVSCFQGGLDRRIRVPLQRGIVGHTATTGCIVNIPDAYSDSRFDKSVDVMTGFRTRNLLTVPIYNNRGEIVGVTEMINRIDGIPFDEEDVRMLMACNVFCGISLDNTRLYQTSLDLTRQLRSFVEMSSTLNATRTVKDVLANILTNAASVIHASRATIYMYDVDTNTLAEFVGIGESDDYGDSFARQVVESRALRIFTKDEVIVTLKLRSLESVMDDNVDERGSRLKTVLTAGQEVLLESMRSLGTESDVGARNLVVIPLLASDSKLLGVMELSCGWKIMNEDVKLLDCFAVFASVSLEKSELQEIATKGALEFDIRRWMLDSERRSFQIPEKLKLDEERLTQVFTLNFDAPLFDGSGHFKVIWAIFDSFHLLERFRLTNEKLFKFVSAISATYKKVPYHNWRHAVDVTQFVQYELKLTGLHEIITAQELFGLMVAALCHDANHDGFTNVYNEKAETPLGILFKNQSVMETHHCTVAIDILSREESNLFSTLNEDEFKAIWTMIIALILSTDMAKHFPFLKAVGERLDQAPLDPKEPKDRFTMLDLILKCADISNVSRPFDMANRWCDVLCEEFFRQGELEMAHGMEYTSPLNDRAHLDKPKSQIGFYTFVCLPLYQMAARAMPALKVNVDQVQSNLAIWKAQQEQQQQQREKGL
jgi:putative methionine-R-sulfoxide reductase with GAF domain